MSKMKYTDVSVAGTFIFAQVQAPNQYSKYSTEFVPDEGEEMKLLRTGLSPKTIKNEKLIAAIAELGLTGRPLFGAERDPNKTANGELLGKPKIVDQTGETEVSVRLGNGTKGILHGTVGAGISNKTGAPTFKLFLDGIQITDLKVFEGQPRGEKKYAPVQGNFVASKDDTTNNTTTNDNGVF